ncbi:MAG: TonB-dependent receptor [Asticcacaulis sp.]
MKTSNTTTRFMWGASGLALSLAIASASYAQSGQAPADTASGASEDIREVVVVGARRAEQSAIDRKKRAATAQDSIVADDVGNFPDKNVGEAISRIAGVALDITDSGDTGGFTIRGQGADLIRVEVDGMSMLPTDEQDGRSVTSLNDMSSDLIKSVDVIKGQTADMRPGGVGGTVRIEQRSGLDFKKPLYKFNLQYQMNTLDQNWSPRANLILTRKFLDGRLGVLFNLTYDDQRTSTDTSYVSNKQVGYQPLGDHDNSPEKTFVTPYDPIAAAVTTKADCAKLTTTGINSRLNCYAQWEDFAPSLPRMRRENRRDTRTSLQLRADYRVNEHLTVFASYNPNLRNQDSQTYNLQILAPTGTTGTTGALTTNMRNVVVNAEHYITSFDMIEGNGVSVNNLVYDSQVRDVQKVNEQHYTQLGADYKAGPWVAKARIQYAFAKSEREEDAFKLNAIIPKASFSLIPENGLWTFVVPSFDLNNPASYYPVLSTSTGIGQNPGNSRRLEYTPYADKNNEWNYQFDATRTFDDFGPLKTLKFGVSHTDRHNETWREGGFEIAPGVTLSRARSLDYIQYCVPSSKITCNYGSTLRNAEVDNMLEKTHLLTREQYQELINVSLIDLPGNQFFGGLSSRGNLISSWKAFDFDAFFGVLGKYADLSAHTIDCLYECIATDGKVYKRPNYSTSERTSSAYLMSNFETRLFGKAVLGNLGVRYQRIEVQASPSIIFQNAVVNPTALAQIQSGVSPTVDVVTTEFVSRRTTNIQRTSEDFLPSLNLALWPVEDRLVLRYSIARQRARPSMAQLTGTSAVTCTYVNPSVSAALTNLAENYPGYWDENDPDTETAAPTAQSRCSGRIGNPELKGYEALTQNLSLEWYPNKDTQVSVSTYAIDVKTGRPKEDLVIPEYEMEGNTYIVSTYRDGDGGLKQTGIEIAARTAFTFLPSKLKYTGAGFNYSTTEANGMIIYTDPLTGLVLPPEKQSSYYYNINVWYDDGRLNARIAYQARDGYYDRMDASDNRVPSEATALANGLVTYPYGSSTSYFKTVTPIYKNGSKSLDARMSYKLNKQVEFFAEGKNLLDDTITRYAPDELRSIGGGVPYVFDTLYTGRRYYFGIITTF